MQPADRLAQAIQNFSNELSHDESDSGVFKAGLVIWEEMSLDDDGNVLHAAYYSALGASVSLTYALGLAEHGALMLRKAFRGDE